MKKLLQHQRVAKLMRSPKWLAIVAALIMLCMSPYLLDVIQGNEPIVFYGQIVDESGRGVAGVVVTMDVTATKRLAVPIPFASSQTGWLVKATTDQDGFFAIHDGRGRSLSIISAQKVGFRPEVWGPSPGNFTYSPSAVNVPRFAPDPSRPEVFHLRHVQ